MNTGFIIIHRKILHWEWYDDITVFRLFMHLLIKANHKDKKWHGIDIKRGSVLTSLSHLSKETKLSVKQIRTSLDKLKSTNEIASKPTNKNTLITVVKYGTYQDYDAEEGTQNGTQEGKQRANKGQTKGKQRATTNNDNNINNINNEDKDIEEIWNLYPRKEGKINAVKSISKLLNQYTKDELITCVNNFIKAKVGTDPKYLPYGSTFFNSQYADYLTNEFVQTEIKVDYYSDTKKLLAMNGVI